MIPSAFVDRGFPDEFPFGRQPVFKVTAEGVPVRIEDFESAFRDPISDVVQFIGDRFRFLDGKSCSHNVLRFF